MEAQPSLNHQPPSDHEKLIPSAPAQASGPSASYLARPLSRVDAPAHRASYALTHSQSAEDVAENHFAGRLGAGQRYTYAEECSSTTLGPSPSKPADAYRDPPWRYLLSPAPFRSPGLWKLAFIEGVGTCLQVYLSGLLGHALIPTATEVSIGPVLPVALASIGQVFLISLFIYATGPITGAHFNPLITLGTFCARLSSLPRTVLYVFFQCLGAVVGAYLLQAGLGVGSHELGPFPGCYIDTSLVTGGEAFSLEVVTCFSVLFLAFGLGLDPRNTSSFGPSLAPLLIGITSALAIYCTGATRKGYLGASTNPARCLGLMAISKRFSYHWVHWTGAIFASAFNGILYWAVPPYKKGDQ